MTEEARPLPAPDSDELQAIVTETVPRLLYGWLYRRRDNPPTMTEIRMFATDALGEPQEHIDRRLRGLRKHFDIQAVPQRQGPPRYVLRGWSKNVSVAEAAVSLRVRAQVLAPQRCFQCGRTPKDDGVKLVVDHRIPQSWGGGNEIENLQPLCEDCNAGKRDYFETQNVYADKIRKAIGCSEPQRRIGELLKAFDGEWVRSDLIGIVASAQEYQEDWQRRLRDLRYLGWRVDVDKRYHEGARVWTYYRLVHAEPWPDNIHDAIVAEEQHRRRTKKQNGLSDSS